MYRSETRSNTVPDINPETVPDSALEQDPATIEGTVTYLNEARYTLPSCRCRQPIDERPRPMRTLGYRPARSTTGRHA